jgi:hypothetical protein
MTPLSSCRSSTPGVDACRFLRLLLGAVDAEIAPICVVNNMPRFSECPGCGTHWCDGCRDSLPFCAMRRGESSDGEV